MGAYGCREGTLMRGAKRLLGLLVLCAAPAAAQPVSDAAINEFVDSHSFVTRVDKIGRWEDPICPAVEGLPANFVKFITKRVRDVAIQAGAPVNADENCKGNIDIVFTPKPQALLDNVRNKQPVLLGYFDSSSQADHMAMVTRPIQAWHATQTVDLRGNILFDSRNILLTSKSQNTTGSRLGNGLRTSFYHAIVVADLGKLADFEMGTLADHVAMLALAQPVTEDVCPGLPSVLDITNSSCRKDAPVKALTQADIGYLRGLYQTDPGTALRSQKDGIVFHIKEALAG